MTATRVTHFRRGFRNRVALLIGAAALLTPLALSGVASAAAPPAPPTPAQRAESIAAPSIVYVGVHWKGWIQTNASIPVDGTLTMTGWQGPFVVNSACSGFVADSTGNIVTAGHCVDNQSMTSGGKALIIDALIAFLHRTYPQLSDNALATVRDRVESIGKVEGKASGSPPQRTVTVYPAGTTSGTGLIASVVDFKSLADGDVALLKANPRTPLPALTVAPATPPIGTALLLGGYAGSVSTVVDPGAEPSYKGGEISSQQTVNGVPFTEVSAEATAGMSGGPAVDMQGRVIGTVSFRPGSEEGAFNFITATSTIRSLLTSNGVSNTLTAADRAYRTGLTAYYAGYYHDAVKSFDEVLAVQPDHARALLYKRLAIQNYPNEVKTSGSNTALFVGVGVGLVVLLAAGVFLVLRRRHRGGPPPVVETPTIVPTPAPTPSQPEELVPRQTVPAAEPEEVAPAEPAEPAVTAPVAAGPAASTGFCPNCGTPHEADAHFCAACGEHFKPLAAATGRGRLNGRT